MDNDDVQYNADGEPLDCENDDGQPCTQEERDADDLADNLGKDD